MKKEAIEQRYIQAWQPIFDAYPQLKAIPVYAWGRYYKYELRGESFEKYIEEDGFTGFQGMVEHQQLDWKLLEEIDAKHNVEGKEMWTGEWGDFSPYRREMAEIYNFDNRGGMCVIVERTDNNLVVNVIPCDSPE